jgi:hypothetical protein
MSNTSDRAYFLEALKKEPLTVNEIVERFGCAANTARTWVKHPEVEKVPGSWPTSYVRKNTLVPITRATASNVPKPDNILRYDIPEPSPEEKETFFRRVMADEAGAMDFIKEFRAADSQKDIRILISKLKSALVVSEYYLDLMKRDGME